MPLINGMKMACEPCIRGHRSTKCTHANERLMVPVRKPGRPLSVCPHPPQQACGCGSVTAAIPRKQTCGCGTGSSAGTTESNGVAGPGESGGSWIDQGEGSALPSDLPSPTKLAFKVQKAARPPSSRKQSFDPVKFERMDMNHVNVIPYERPQNVPALVPNGYLMERLPQSYEFAPQYANMQMQYGQLPMQTPTDPNGMKGNEIRTGLTNGYTNGTNGNGLEHVMESPLATPTTFGSGDSGKFIKEDSYGSPETPKNGFSGEVQAPSNGGSCCASERNGHSQKSSRSSISNSERPVQGSCCSSKPESTIVKRAAAQGSCCSSKPESRFVQRPAQGSCCTPRPESNFGQESIATGSVNSSPHLQHQMMSQNGIHGMAFNPALYPQYGPQPTVFTYPATYGSFQNPLQPSAWRESIRSNNYSQMGPLPPAPLPFDTPLVPETLDTVHTCGCGDSCQCVGCAAHPYNDATQEYVRSAWASMNLEQPNTANELYNSPQSTSNGKIPSQPPPVNQIASPPAHTPSSTTSGNEEEQSLSAADFFFVNYPFTEDGCGGDTQSCPCGDDCQCLGCTIHRQPTIPCAGDEDSCPCGADCECIGCSIHDNGIVA